MDNNKKNSGAIASDSFTKELKGIFELTIKDKSGKVIEKYEDKNLIVDKARFNMAHLISASANNTYIDAIGFGTGTAPASADDLVLTGSTQIPFDAISYPLNNAVTFEWSLGYSDLVGMSITEFGLISHNGDLFSRKVRSAIVKADDITMNGKWTILF
jgi:hypothetical protein